MTRVDGEWFRIARAGHEVACCHCGLVHLVKSRRRDRSIEIQMTRLPRQTGGRRAALKKRKRK